MLGVVIIQYFPFFNKEKDFIMSTLNIAHGHQRYRIKLEPI